MQRDCRQSSDPASTRLQDASEYPSPRTSRGQPWFRLTMGLPGFKKPAERTALFVGTCYTPCGLSPISKSGTAEQETGGQDTAVAEDLRTSKPGVRADRPVLGKILTPIEVPWLAPSAKIFRPSGRVVASGIVNAAIGTPTQDAVLLSLSV